MRFYKHAHAFYAGVDLHARSVSPFPWKERGDNVVGAWEHESA